MVSLFSGTVSLVRRPKQIEDSRALAGMKDVLSNGPYGCKNVLWQCQI